MYALLLGSNSGNPFKNIEEAIIQLKTIDGHISSESGIYRTAPWGNTNQLDFLNKLVLFETPMPPGVLLNNLLEIEQKMGRIRSERWGPRTIDIDILYAGDLVIETEGLRIPHPGIPDRRFALIPLNALIPDFIHPTLGISQRELLHRCSDQGAVELITEPFISTLEKP
jgi:2-amino-4-hydroxy-6-hydroxymethyldihydropteridine diphosphokinase